MVTLADVCSVRSSLVDPTLAEHRELPHIGPDSIERDTGRLVGYRSAADDRVASGKYKFGPGDILYSKIRPNLNKVARATFNGLCSADIYALVVDPRRAEPEFIVHLLRDRRFLTYAVTCSSRASIPKINREQLMRYTFELPPINEQRRIAAILDRAEALRAKRLRVLAQLDKLSHAIFHDMFGNGGSHIEGGEEIPLGDLVTLKSGEFLPASRQDGGPYPVFGGNGVAGYHSKYLFEEPRLAIGRVGAYCGAVHLTPPKSWITDNALYVARTAREIELEYLHDALRGANLNQFASQSGQPLISASRLRGVAIHIPAPKAQQAFGQRSRAVRARRLAFADAVVKTDGLFASLQDAAFRGQA